MISMQTLTIEERQAIVDGLKIGADPELFVKSGSKLVSAVGLVPGTKANPHKVDKGAVQLDGMAAEFNIDPATNSKEFRENIQAVMEQLKEIVGEEYTLSPQPVAEFGRELISQQPLSSQELGCEPDFNAYTGLENTPPNSNADFRTGAGHIHLGWTEGVNPSDPEHFANCRAIVIALDSVLAYASMLFDGDTKRRRLYGQLGAFRPKPYGLEYRTLSNVWLSSPELVEWIFETTKAVFSGLVLGDFTVDTRCYYNFNHGEDSWVREEAKGYLLSSPFGLPPKPLPQVSEVSKDKESRTNWFWKMLKPKTDEAVDSGIPVCLAK